MIRRNRSTLLYWHVPRPGVPCRRDHGDRGKVLARRCFPRTLRGTVSRILELGWASGVSDIPAREWDALVDEDDPFLEHAFLLALERSGSVGTRAGWKPRFVVVRDGGSRLL